MDMIGSSISIDGTKIKANASSRQSKSSDAIEKEMIGYSKRVLRQISMKMKFMVTQHHIKFQKS
jgi:hypothetical protein